MYITTAITAILACSAVAALPLPKSPLSSPEQDDFAFQLLNSRKRVLLAPVVEKFSFLKKSEGLAPHDKFSFLIKGDLLKSDYGPHDKRGFMDLLAIPDLVSRIKSWKEDGYP
jgi:hypothetical protein